MSEPVPIRPQPQTATFDDFWKMCPRKIDRALCRAKWEAIVNGGLETKMLDRDSGAFIPVMLKATPQEIIDGFKRFLKTLPRKPNSYDFLEPQFIPHPSTWLNRGRWMDES